MARSPGHRKWPDHTVDEQRVDKAMKVRVGPELIAASGDVINVVEEGQPDRFYFPRADVNLALMTPSDTTTACPFKGTARYFHVRAGDTLLEDAAWTYETPYEEHRELAGRLAFDDGKYGAIHISEG